MISLIVAVLCAAIVAAGICTLLDAVCGPFGG